MRYENIDHANRVNCRSTRAPHIAVEHDDPDEVYIRREAKSHHLETILTLTDITYKAAVHIAYTSCLNTDWSSLFPDDQDDDKQGKSHQEILALFSSCRVS